MREIWSNTWMDFKKIFWLALRMLKIEYKAGMKEISTCLPGSGIFFHAFWRPNKSSEEKQFL